MSNEDYKYYIMDIVSVLIEQALDSKSEEKKNKSSNDIAFWQGHTMAYYSVLSLLQEQAEVFEIPLDSIGLDKINPDKNLLDLTVVARKNKPENDSKQ